MWLIILGSLAIIGHLGAVVVMVIAAPSGPWASPFGMSMALAPQFAQSAYNVATPAYLNWIKMTHNYHFPTNRPGAPGVYFEIKLKDESGKIVDTLKFPDPDANAFVRHRQTLLARGLADDVPIPPRGSESVAAPKKDVNKIAIWDMTEPGKLQLRAMPEHMVPRDRPVFRPSDWTMILAKSYARYVARSHGAASAELVRHSKDPMPPIVLYFGEIPSAFSEELTSNFGELTHE
jgi:hypothetical protein